MNEEAILFGPGKSIVGIVTAPASPEGRHRSIAVVLLNAGLVHRAGPGRIYVKLARELAGRGLVTLRFDFSGIGDSPARSDNLCFEKSVIAETQEAMDHLAQTGGIDQFILMGGCSGALASFETALCDARVLGAVLINFQFPDVEDEGSNSHRSTRNAAHYYQSLALSNPESWRRLLTGKSDYAQVIRVLRHAMMRRFIRAKATSETSRFQTKLRELCDRDVKVIFICSQGDPTLKELREQGGARLKRIRSRERVIIESIAEADHTFTTHLDQERLINVACKRIDEIVCSVKEPARELPRQHAVFKPFLQRVEAEELPRGK